MQTVHIHLLAIALAVTLASPPSHGPGAADALPDLDIDGRQVTLVNGYPSTDSIDDAIWDHRGFVFYPNLGLFAETDAADPIACSVRYQPPARPDAGPGIAVTSGGC